MIRVGLFIDGGFFSDVSDYYRYHHQRHARISLIGLQDYIQVRIAQLEKQDVNQCQVVEAHYFRGRFSARSAETAGKLMDERRFDDVLMRAGIVQHYLPLQERGNRVVEKGVNVWLALEALDLAVHKGLDVVVLLASDGDYVPLARKLSSVGTRVMLLGWDFEFQTEYQGESRVRITRTSSELLRCSTYPLLMNEEIDEGIEKDSNLIEGIFAD